MIWEKESFLPATNRGARIALIFALVAERLAVFYEHGQWLALLKLPS